MIPRVTIGVAYAAAMTLALSVAAADATPTPRQVDVFTTEDIDIAAGRAGPRLREAGVALTVYRLDAVKRLERRINQRLPQGPRNTADIQRTAQALRRQLTDGPMRQALVEGYRGLAAAERYGIDKLPAIVFDDGDAVVYGARDLDRALKAYRDWRQSQ